MGHAALRIVSIGTTELPSVRSQCHSLVQTADNRTPSLSCAISALRPGAHRPTSTSPAKHPDFPEVEGCALALLKVLEELGAGRGNAISGTFWKATGLVL
jgi:hypothetical protein